MRQFRIRESRTNDRKSFDILIGDQVIRSQLHPYGDGEAAKIVREHFRPAPPIREVPYNPGPKPKGRTYEDDE